MQSLIRRTTAFVELLSLGFATIGVQATLKAVGSQLLEETVTRIAHPQRRSMPEASTRSMAA
jgi:hypothetical protein